MMAWLHLTLFSSNIGKAKRMEKIPLKSDAFSEDVFKNYVAKSLYMSHETLKLMKKWKYNIN